MKFKLLFFLILVFNCIKIFSQSPVIQWEKTFGGSSNDYAKSIQQTQDGGYIFAGSTNSNNGSVAVNHGTFDCWIVKMDVSGNIQWQKSYGGSSSDRANSIQQTQDGGYIFAGYSSSTDGDVTGNDTSGNYWVVKLDPSGNIQWQKSLGGNGVDEATSVQQTSDGGYIVAGQSTSTDIMGGVTGNHGAYDYWIVKLNSLGNMQWQKSFGGSNNEYAGSIKQTLDNGYIMIGSTLSNNGNVSLNHGFRDYWVIKIDSSGNLQWEKSLGGSGLDEGFDILQSQDGGYMVAGYAISSDGQVSDFKGSRDVWIVKLDGVGNLIWQKNFGGSNIDGAYSINKTSDGGYILGGYTQSNDGDVTTNFGNIDYWLLKLDSSGVLQWQKSLGGSNADHLYCVKQTSDNGYILIGQTLSSDGNLSLNYGATDIWVVKLGSNLGVEENKNIFKPSLYPNPAKDFVNIDNLPKKTTISITDISGRKLFSNQYNDKKITISTSNLVNGVYIIRAENSGHVILSEKLIIKK